MSYGRGGALDSGSSPSSQFSSSSWFGWSCCAAYSGGDEVGEEHAVTDTAAEFRRSSKSGIVALTASPELRQLQEHQRLKVKQILVVEDESRIVRIVRDYLERARYRVAVEMQTGGCACVRSCVAHRFTATSERAPVDIRESVRYFGPPLQVTLHLKMTPLQTLPSGLGRHFERCLPRYLHEAAARSFVSKGRTL